MKRRYAIANVNRAKLQARCSLLLAALLLAATANGPTARAQESILNGFNDYVNKALREWEVPGVAIAIVKNDQVVFAKGYGVRKLGDPTPVNEKTIFAIGSASKAFTAAAVAMLVDEGKIKWDDPATQYLPGFQLFDPYVTRELTVRDLLCHRSGLERGDLLWYGSPYDRGEILRRVRYLKPTWSLRSTFGYQNIMYLAAGQIVEKVSGKSWDDFTKERIFAPLGMAVSSTSIKPLAGMDNVAAPHGKVDEKVQPIPWRNIDNIAPAGSINSNVVEVAQWVRLQLGEGAYQGTRLISSGAVKEMHASQTVIRYEPPWSLLMPEAHFLNYGLGWFLHDYRGRKVVQHGGNIDGMSALVAMIPEEKLGVVVLTNLNGNLLTEALAYRVFDAYLGATPRDWSAEFLKSFKALEEQGKAAQKKAEEARVKGTKPSLALDKYAGAYKDDMYGEVKVTEENGKLALRTAAFAGDLEHWHYDTFQVTWKDRTLGKGLVTFTLNSEGKVDELKIPTLQATFKRAPDAARPEAAVSLSEADLRKFVGKYAMQAPPIEVSIELVGGKLKAVVPGQPVHTLVPVAANKFRIDGAPEGFFVQFEMVGDRVKSMTLAQGQGPSFTLLPKP
ncbi:MAG TPA: serine hydrolase [Blastocatellia bacterium]|nr:serine hydrolase [Blastocatellia bacterium]